LSVSATASAGAARLRDNTSAVSVRFIFMDVS
jgi:hypothetical protein